MLDRIEKLFQHLLGVPPGIALQLRVERLEKAVTSLEEELRLAQDLLESARATVDKLEARANEWIDVKGYS